MPWIKKSICGLLLVATLSLHGQGRLIQVGVDSVLLYVEDIGKGKPVVFIPGWTMTTEFFAKQRNHFGNSFRYISYDPRSHGRSSKTMIGNTYKNHADDLRDLIQALNLKDVVLVGWSSGSATIYEYVKYYGIEGLSHLIFIDEPPKWIGNTAKEWVYGTFQDYRESLKDLINDRKAYASGTARWMTRQPLDTVQEKWMIDQMLMTPNDAALSLYIDGMVSDYNQILVGLNGRLPMLFMLRESWHLEASEWLKAHVPEAKTTPITSHAAFWEEAQDFNKTLGSFIKNEAHKE